MSDTNYYMLVRKGHVQRSRIKDKDTGESILAWLVTETHDDAWRLIKFLCGTNHRNVRPALIGSLQGETLEVCVRSAMHDGCRRICCVHGWNEDGSPVFKSTVLA